MVLLPDRLSLVNSQIEESVRLKRTLAGRSEIMVSIARELCSAFQSGNKVLLCGNGGSAADAQHIAAELAGRFRFDRPPLPALAITTNTSILTAIANDYRYEDVFARQVQALVKPGDILIGMSTSGSSPNVVHAMEAANRAGAVTIAFTGHGGKLKEIAGICLDLPSDDPPRIQEAHITAGHIICCLVEEDLFGSGLP